jgi:hypothetical protein
MSRVSRLKDVPGVSIDFDFPKEVQDARTRLWPKFKQYSSLNWHSKVRIVYPAKLIVDGRVLHDEFPEWNACVCGKRLQMIDNIEQQPDRRQSTTFQNRLNVQGQNALPMPDYRAEQNSSMNTVMQNNNSLTNVRFVLPLCLSPFSRTCRL